MTVKVSEVTCQCKSGRLLRQSKSTDVALAAKVRPLTTNHAGLAEQLRLHMGRVHL